MKIYAPNFVKPAQKPLHEKHAAAVVAAIAAITNRDALTFDEVRDLPALAAIKDELHDGVLHQIALDAALKVAE